MADPVSPGNAANAPGAVVSTTPHRGVVAAQRARAGRGETLALIESGKADAAAAKPSTPKPNGTNGAHAPAQLAAKPAAKPAITPTPTEEPSDDDRDREATSEAAPETPATPDVSNVADPETTKRLSTIQAAEKRSRDKIAAERKELDARAKAIEAEWSPRAKAAADFEALKAKAKKGGVHLVDALRALGVGDDDLEPAAQALYAHSKAGAADPTRKAAADRMMAERAHVTELEEVRAELRELRDGLSQRDEQQTFERRRATFLDHTVKAIGDDAPIAKALATKNPTKLRAALWAMTVELTEANDGEVPDFPDVVAAYEAQRSAELEELGVAMPKAAKQPTETDETKPNNKTADKQNPARTLSNDLSTPRVPRPAQSGDEHRKANRKDTLRMLESGKLE